MKTQFDFELPKSEICWGADPEFFMRDGANLLPAFTFLPHKHEAESRKFKTRWDNIGTYKIYWDGFQAEWASAVHPGFECIHSHATFQQHAMFDLLQFARKKHPKATLTLENVVRVPEKWLKPTIEDDFVALGCMPSRNAYNRKGKQVADGRKLKYRFAGGHIHFGSYTPKFVHEHAARIVKCLDSILGVWSVGAAKSIDNPIRRQYYGLAGEFRTPKHGLEYRTLSNFYYAHPSVFNLVHNIARASIHLALRGLEKAWVSDDTMVQESINNSDTKLAARILRLNKSLFEFLLRNERYTSKMQKSAYIVGLEGIESVIKDPTNIEQNWMLTSKVQSLRTLPKWITVSQ